MRKYFITVILFLFILHCPAFTLATSETVKGNNHQKIIDLDIPFKKLLAEPREDAKVTYDIPIGIRVIARTADRKWYKARISFNFVGYFQYEGWVKVE